MDPVPKDLIKKLLVADRSKRLGSLKVRVLQFSFSKMLIYQCSIKIG